MFRNFLNEKGLTPVILLVLLVGGLAAGLYAFNYARTVMKPKASEFDGKPVSTEITYSDKKGDKCKDEVRCEGNTAVNYYRSTDVALGQCKEEKAVTNMTCTQAFCDDLSYYDPNAEAPDPNQGGKMVKGWVMHKRATSYNFSNPDPIERCTYAFTPRNAVGIQTSAGSAVGVSTQCKPEIYCDNTVLAAKFVHKYVKSDDAFDSGGNCKWVYDNTNVSCNVAGAKAALEAGFGITVVPTPQADSDLGVCNPGERVPGICTRCNSTGNGYNKLGADWGVYTAKGDTWCSCASRYSEEIYGKEYDQNNYPQCF